MSRSLYLDYAATTPLDPRVAAAMQELALAGHVNPASLHQAGRRARRLLENAREAILAALGARLTGMETDRLLFTSGGTEANNLALLGLAGRERARIVISSIEHPSIMGAADELTRRGYQVERISVSTAGVLDLDHARELLRAAPRAKLVSAMLVNNETGVLQPIAELAVLCREVGVPLHCDLVQAVGKQAIDFLSLDISAATIAPHKFYGPVGVGGLILRPDLTLEPQLYGGFQQAGFRPGTESVLLVIGFQQALALATPELAEQTRTLRDHFEQALLSQLDDVVIQGITSPRAPHISNAAFLGVDRQQLFLALDFAGVYCSTGSACASGSSEPSPVLRAMGLAQGVVSSALRFSFGAQLALADCDLALERILRCVKDLRQRKSPRI